MLSVGSLDMDLSVGQVITYVSGGRVALLTILVLKACWGWLVSRELGVGIMRRGFQYNMTLTSYCHFLMAVPTFHFKF